MLEEKSKIDKFMLGFLEPEKGEQNFGNRIYNKNSEEFLSLSACATHTTIIIAGLLLHVIYTVFKLFSKFAPSLRIGSSTILSDFCTYFVAKVCGVCVCVCVI